MTIVGDKRRIQNNSGGQVEDLHQALTEARQREAAIRDILRVINQSPTDYQPVFDAILEHATRLCDAAMGILFLREEEGFDVCETAVSAYSTLGWLADPVTSPMLDHGPARLVETILHELVHATAFLPDEADFNEGVALFIGQQAAIRFFESPPGDLEIPLPKATKVAETIADRRRLPSGRQLAE